MEINILAADAIRSFKDKVEPIYTDYDREMGGGLVARFREAAK